MEVTSDRACVLVIDDDLLTRAALSDALGEAGYEVHSAEDGEAGLRATREHGPDFVVCDWIMPRVDGLEYCRRVRSDPELRGTHVALLTGRFESSDRVRGLDAGADDFLAKPIETDELLARIRAGLRLRAMRRQQAADARKEALVEVAATLGHDLNNPLTALLGYVELLQLHLDRDDTRQLAHNLKGARAVIEQIADIGRRLNGLGDPETVRKLKEMRRALGKPSKT